MGEQVNRKVQVNGGFGWCRIPLRWASVLRGGMLRPWRVQAPPCDISMNRDWIVDYRWILDCRHRRLFCITPRLSPHFLHNYYININLYHLINNLLLLLLLQTLRGLPFMFHALSWHVTKSWGQIKLPIICSSTADRREREITPELRIQITSALEQ